MDVERGEVEKDKEPLLVYIPIWVRITVFLIVMVIASALILAIPISGKSSEFATKLMAERLANNAAMRAIQIQRDLAEVESRVAYAFSRGIVIDFMNNYNYGNVTSDQWSSILSQVHRVFSIDNVYVAMFFYDGKGDIIYDYKDQLSNVTTPSMVPKSLSAKETECLLPLNGTGSAKLENLETLRTMNETALVRDPIPMLSMDQTSYVYVYSMSVPVMSIITDIEHKTQIRKIVGYATLLLRANSVLSLATDDEGSYFDKSTIVLLKLKDEKVANNNLQYSYLLPDRNSSTYPATWRAKSGYNHMQSDEPSWYPIGDYPALINAKDLKRHAVEQPRGAVMTTHTPFLHDASVGYSYVDLGDHRWYILIVISEATAHHEVRRLRDVILASCAGIIVAVVCIMIPLSQAQTRPFYQLYQGMNFQDPPTMPHIGPTPGRGPHIVVSDEVANHEAANHEASTISSGRTLVEHGDIPVEASEMSLAQLDSAKDNCNHNQDHDTRLSREFQIPLQLAKLCRWYTDDWDDIVSGYNKVIEQLQIQRQTLEKEVSERTKEAERAKEAAESANRTKQAFIANITHELRTPLNGILGMTTVSASENDPEKIKASLQTIIESGKALMELLNDLLSYSRSQVAPRPDVTEFTIQELVEVIRDAAVTKVKLNNPNTPNINVIVDSLYTVDKYRYNCIWGDHSRILQITTLVLSNAIKFSEPGSRVVVDVNVRVGCKDAFVSLDVHHPQSSGLDLPDLPDDASETETEIDHGPNEPQPVPQIQTVQTVQTGQAQIAQELAIMEIVVRDQGQGISPRQMKRIFEMFTQGDNSLSKRYKGTGLGMCVAKQLADCIGGYITVVSEERQGSIVVLRAPVLVEPVWPKIPSIRIGFDRPYSIASSQPQLVIKGIADYLIDRPSLLRLSLPESKTKAADFRVLVVDDNSINRSILVGLLKQLKVRADHIDLANDGKQAIRLVEKSIIDGVFYGVILMDLQMPAVSGIEATHFVRSTLGYPYPIVAITGYDDHSFRRFVAEGTIQEVLIKPVMKTSLAKTISRYMYMED